jgi:hypothetical protein
MNMFRLPTDCIIDDFSRRSRGIVDPGDRSMLKFATAVASVAVTTTLLAACAKPLEVASITDVQSKTGSKGIDVHEPRRAKGQSGVPDFAGDQLLEVRTYEVRNGEGQVEFPGASCTVAAADFAATATTPAKVRVPLYRGQSSQLAVSCEMPGFQKRLATVAAQDETRNQRLGSGANGGLIGVALVAAVDAMSDNSKNDWRYPTAQVVMEREGRAKP